LSTKKKFHMFPGEVIGAATTTVFLASPIAAISGAAGAAVAAYVDVKLQDFEGKCKTGTYKVRWCTAQGVRLLLFGGGTALTVTAVLGIITATSILATVAVASCGIGLAVVGGIGLVAAIARYRHLSGVMKAYEAREARIQIVQTCDTLTDEEIQETIRSGILSAGDLTDMLRNETPADAARKFLRLRSFV
jgi:hypothetical protein